MRLTLRCIIASLGAVEQGLTEVTNKARSGAVLSRYYADLKMAGKLVKEARQALSAIGDRMIDSGDGE